MSNEISESIYNAIGINRELRLKRVKQVTIVGLTLNLLLASVKITISIIFGSIAVLADGLDSALDLATTLLGYVAVRISDKPADKDHQFGHEKYENFFSLGIAVLLMASSGIIGYQAITRLISQTALEFSYANVIIASLSIILKGVLVFVNIIVGRKIESSILVANGKNFRSDVLTSLVVLISVTVGSLKVNGLSLFWIDPTIAIIISIVIILTAVQITRESASVLLDQSPNPETIEQIKKIAMKNPGVKDISNVRARNIGTNIILADLDILIDPHLTIEEGHDIATEVEKTIKSEMPVKYVQIHVEPYSDNHSLEEIDEKND